MSEHGQEAQDHQAPEDEHEAKRRSIDEVQRQLDEESQGDGLAAESGRGEETGLSEG